MNKIQKTNNERYGGSAPACNEEIINKIQETNLSKYNTKCTLQVEEIKNKTIQTNIERYGVQNPMFNDKIFKKQQQNLFKRKQYKNWNVLGYEDITLEYLITKEYTNRRNKSRRR